MNNSFEKLYKESFDELYYYALGLIGDIDIAKDIVQEAFLKYYNNRIEIKVNAKPYLFKTIKNLSINIHKHDGVKGKYVSHCVKSNDAEEIDYSEQIKIIKEVLDTLPEKSKRIFVLSVVESMKYKEIAEEFQISTDTVKFHISKVYKAIREKLSYNVDMCLVLITLLQEIKK